ncbi:MAG: NDP-sugar synthase [Myxococcota bacterium]|nr:NDP-sugar synthase [Myxococcota bacterium]
MSAPLYGVILAAGRGTRIAPLSAQHPKPLIPTLGRPLWELHLLALERLGVSMIAVNGHHLGDQVVRAAAQWHQPPIVCLEETLLGTGGGLCAMAKALYQQRGPGTIVVLNGDALFDFALAPALERHRSSGAVATLALRPTEPGDPFGRVAFERGGEVLRIAEVEGPRAAEATGLGAFTGLQIVDPPLIERLDPTPSDSFRSGYRWLLREGVPIQSHLVDPHALWVDVGTPQRYQAAHWALLERSESALWERLPAGHRFDWGVLGAGARIEEGASLKGPVWVGPNAVVGAGVHAERAIIWPGVELREDCVNAVATPRGVISLSEKN